jgi:hypothetical protein
LSKYEYKVSFEHCKEALGWNLEDGETKLNIALKNDAMISLQDEVFLFPEGISRAYADRADEMFNESKEANCIGNALLSVRSCLLALHDLVFFTDYVFGATEYTDTIPPLPELRSVVSNLLADRKRIQDRLMDLYELLLNLTIAEAEESDSSESPVANCIKQ